MVAATEGQNHAMPEMIDDTSSPARPTSAIVDCALYEDGARRPGSIPLHAALESARAAATRNDAGDTTFVWIGLREPTSEEFDAVAEEFSLHPLAVEDAIHAHQRPKLETYADTAFLVLKTVGYVDSEEVVDLGELMLFVGANFVVSVRHGHASPLGDVRKALEARREELRAGPAAVLHAVADRVVDDYERVALKVAEDIEQIEYEVFSGDRNDHAQRIYKLKREVLTFQRAVRPLAEPLRQLAAGNVPHVDKVTAQYFRDVHDHVLRTADQLDNFSQLLNSILEANTANVTMRQNEDMRKITAWVAILAWITMIAGIYGMNFTHMPELEWFLGYPFAIGLMVGGAAVLYRAFRRNRWL